MKVGNYQTVQNAVDGRGVDHWSRGENDKEIASDL